jgi:hypothetical protein
MNKILLTILCIVCFAQAQAQISNDTTGGGAAVIIKDTRLAVLEKKYFARKSESAKSKTTKTTKTTKPLITRTSSSGIVLVNGYRLMVLSTPDRAEAYRVRGLLHKYFSNDKQYLIFQMPNSKLKLGNYLDRKQADAVRKKILALKIVTNNIFIVSDQVEMRVKKTELTDADEQEVVPTSKSKKVVKPTKPSKTVKQ